jgi:hypothetical protein
MDNASALKCKNRASWHQLLIVLVDQHPCYRGLKSMNHRRELGETLISLGRDRAIFFFADW